MRRRAQILRAQDSVADGVGATLIKLREGTPDHQGHHSIVADFVLLQFADISSVAQHDHPIGEELDLCQPMRDVNNADAARPQPRHQLKKLRGLILRQAGCRLIHD